MKSCKSLIIIFYPSTFCYISTFTFKQKLSKKNWKGHKRKARKKQKKRDCCFLSVSFLSFGFFPFSSCCFSFFFHRTCVSYFCYPDKRFQPQYQVNAILINQLMLHLNSILFFVIYTLVNFVNFQTP